MTSSLVGARYAKALLESVLAPGSPISADETIRQIRLMEEILTTSPELRAVLSTPAVQTERKRAVVSKLADMSGISPLVKSFLFVVLNHKRIAQLPEIRQSFELLNDQNHGFVRAQVTSAAPLEQAELKTIEAELARISGKQVRLETSLDPSLIGGVRARVGSIVYDGSLRGQLEVMRRKLTGDSVDYKVGI